MSLTIDRNSAIIINRGGRAHRTGWVRLADGSIAPGTTDVKVRRGQTVHMTTATGGALPVGGALTVERFMALTGWAAA